MLSPKELNLEDITVVTCEVKRHVEIKSFGDFGLQALPCWITSRQIESGR
jgi:ribosomal protein L16/L10AE